MISDRFYMRTPNNPKSAKSWFDFLKSLSAVNLLVLLNAAAFLIEILFSVLGLGGFISNAFSLSLGTLKYGFVWTLFSYSFLHGGFLHILLNMFALVFIGRNVEFFVGYKKFMIAYFSAVFLGGIVWLLTGLIVGKPSLLLGASGGVAGIVAMFCMLVPDRKLTFLLFFIVPVSMRPKVMLAIIAGIEFFNFLFFEIHSGPSSVGIGFSSHLGGMLAGVIYALILDGKLRFLPFCKFGKKPMGSARDYSFKIDMQYSGGNSRKNYSDSELRAKVNEILDKLNEKGFSSLNDEEKEILSIAKDRLK